ncbi:GNAT family N-acetyltransferase [Leucobacter sp. W1478]|uniref:GNAT family N-acetyltransferase n=1 Tax=Leucobacter sp. W1478 TaxID=3439065 RepID=UPI003F2A5F5F
MSHSLDTGYEFAYVTYHDPIAAPLLKDLEREYDERYGIDIMGEPAIAEIERYPAERFAPPLGAFLVLLHEGEAVSGGAFMPYDEATAEVKRVWTSSERRGQGLARIVLAELEREAARLGYARIYLTTGPRQPEARALYLATGYTPFFDTDLSGDEIGGPLPFEKLLPSDAQRAEGRAAEVSESAA